MASLSDAGLPHRQSWSSSCTKESDWTRRSTDSKSNRKNCRWVRHIDGATISTSCAAISRVEAQGALMGYSGTYSVVDGLVNGGTYKRRAQQHRHSTAQVSLSSCGGLCFTQWATTCCFLLLLALFSCRCGACHCKLISLDLQPKRAGLQRRATTFGSLLSLHSARLKQHLNWERSVSAHDVL